MEEKTSRTLTDIQTEYTQLAAKYGHTMLQIIAFQNQLPAMEEIHESLSKEMAALSCATPPPAETV